MKAKIPRSETVSLVAAELKKNPDATMDELCSVGEAQGHNVYPLIVGLARKELGMGRKAPTRGKRKPAPTAKETAPAPRRGRKASKGDGTLDFLQNVVEHVRTIEKEVARQKAVLAKIADLAAAK